MFSKIRVFAFFFAVMFFHGVATTSHPPPAGGCGHGHDHGLEAYGGCALHDGFVPIPHTGRRYLLHLMDKLAPAAGENPDNYSVDIIRETAGPEYINAMTCASSKVIWVSRKAFQELYGYEPALAFLLAHEIGHGSFGSVVAADGEGIRAAEGQLLGQLTYAQRREIAVDQRAAEIMLNAGYSEEAVLAGARYILWQDGAELVLQSGPSHPGGWDRVALLGYYLERRAGLSAPVAAGRVLPR